MESDWSWANSLQLRRVIRVWQTPCTPSLLWGADQQWWRHRYGRRRGWRMLHVLVSHATRYGPSWIFPGVWPHVQVRKKEAQFELLNIYLCEKLFYKNRTKNMATDRARFINRERRFLRQDLSQWRLCESCWGKNCPLQSGPDYGFIWLIWTSMIRPGLTNHRRPVLNLASKRWGERKRKRYIYIFTGGEGCEREKKFIKFYFDIYPTLQFPLQKSISL